MQYKVEAESKIGQGAAELERIGVAGGQGGGYDDRQAPAERGEGKGGVRSSAKMASPAKVGPMMEDIDTLVVLKVTPDLGAAWPIRDGK